jgi:hypothetical protein
MRFLLRAPVGGVNSVRANIAQIIATIGTQNHSQNQMYSSAFSNGSLMLSAGARSFPDDWPSLFNDLFQLVTNPPADNGVTIHVRLSVLDILRALPQELEHDTFPRARLCVIVAHIFLDSLRLYLNRFLL